MQISPKYSADDWKRLAFSSESDWQKAIDIFEDRIRGRFFEIIDHIIKLRNSGFAILALDSLLIETLEQFKKGVKETPRRESKSYFVSFLTRTSFNNFFDEDSAGKFYEQIRCGILHQAEIKQPSLVRNKKELSLVSSSEDNAGVIIQRTLFHNKLIAVYDEYVNELRENSNVDLRTNFRKKMNYICNTPAFAE